MRPLRGFHSAREEGNSVFAKFMIVHGYQRVKQFLPSIQMGLATLERTYRKTREMRNRCMHVDTVPINTICIVEYVCIDVHGHCQANRSHD